MAFENFSIVPSYQAVKQEILITKYQAMDYLEVYVKNKFLGKEDKTSMGCFLAKIWILYMKSKYLNDSLFEKLSKEKGIGEPYSKALKIFNTMLTGFSKVSFEDARFLLDIMAEHIYRLGITDIKFRKIEGLKKVTERYNLNGEDD